MKNHPRTSQGQSENSNNDNRKKKKNKTETDEKRRTRTKQKWSAPKHAEYSTNTEIPRCWKQAKLLSKNPSRTKKIENGKSQSKTKATFQRLFCLVLSHKNPWKRRSYSFLDQSFQPAYSTFSSGECLKEDRTISTFSYAWGPSWWRWEWVATLFISPHYHQPTGSQTTKKMIHEDAFVLVFMSKSR